MKNKGKTTIKDIAREVNMTTITVSRALNTPEKVKKETRERILAVTRRLNYVPNALARNLKNRESRLIGLISASFDNPFYGEVIKAISREAKRHDYSILLFDTDGLLELETRAIDILLSYQVAGILLSPVSDDDDYLPPYLPRLELTNIPVIQVDRQIALSKFAGVYLDNVESGYRGCKALLHKGYRHLLVVGGPEKSRITQARIQGIRRALDECPDSTQLDVLYGDYTQAPARDEVGRYLASGRRPEAIFGLNILITLGALEAIHLQGLSHRNFGLISIDKVPYAEIFGNGIPSVTHDTYQLGLTAINMLLHQIDDPGYQPMDKIIPGILQP
ncbi:MAG: LacI family DNA-binding transcriptional regulator [Desulfopila sp.]